MKKMVFEDKEMGLVVGTKEEAFWTEQKRQYESIILANRAELEIKPKFIQFYEELLKFVNEKLKSLDIDSKK